MIELNTNIDELMTRAQEIDVRGNQNTIIKLVQDLEDAMKEHDNLMFICAQEIGHTERAVDVRFADDTYIFINPVIKECGRVKLSREYDRILKKDFIVPRFSYIELIFQDCLGSVKGIKLENEGAMVLSQALDMLDGVYPGDIGLEIIPEFDEASPEEQEEVLKEYIKTFKERFNELDSELSNGDEKTKGLWNAIKFMAAKSKGDVKEYKDEPLSKRKQKQISKTAKSILNQANKLKFWNKLKKDKKENV